MSKKFFYAFFTALFLFTTQGGKIAAQTDTVSPDVERAFAAVGIPIVRRKVSPPDFTLPLLGGGTARLSAYRGKVVFLNFWATWCPPCRAEMPSMETLHRRFAGEGLVILAVDYAEKTAAVEAFIRENKLTFLVGLDSPGSAGRVYGISAIPATFIIDREGKIITRVNGSLLWDDPKIIRAFEVLLKN